MGYLDNYREKLGSKKSRLELEINRYSKDFKNLDSYKSTIFLLPDGTQDTYEFHVLDKTKIALNPKKKIVPGSTFEMRDLFWIVYDTKPVDDIVTVGKYEEVNAKIDWILNGQIQSTPAFVTDNINQGIDETKFLSLGDGRIILLVPKNEQTAQLKRNKRLMIDGNPYKIEKIQTYEYNGCYRIRLMEDVILKGDSETICDYDTLSVPLVDGIQGANTISKGKNSDFTLRVGGLSTNFDSWSLTFDEGVVANGVQTLNTIKISVGTEMSNVGKTMILSVVKGVTTFTKEILIVSLF
jgi:hypothetical protein